MVVIIKISGVFIRVYIIKRLVPIFNLQECAFTVFFYALWTVVIMIRLGSVSFGRGVDVETVS